MKLFNLTDTIPDEHCSGCVEGKSRMMSPPKGHTERPIMKSERAEKKFEVKVGLGPT